MFSFFSNYKYLFLVSMAGSFPLRSDPLLPPFLGKPPDDKNVEVDSLRLLVNVPLKLGDLWPED